MSEAGAISRTRSPLSRNAGEGLGVRASRSAGAEGGMSVAAAILRLSTIPRSRTTPLPQRGRGAGGEGLPQRGRGAGGEGLPQRGRGAGGEGLPQRGRGAGGEGLPQRGRGAGGEGAHGTFPTRNPGC